MNMQPLVLLFSKLVTTRFRGLACFLFLDSFILDSLFRYCFRMKFLEVFQLQKISMALSPSGTTTSTSIELFSCAAGADKKLYKSLDTLHHQRSALTGSSSTAAATPSLRASGSGAPGEGASRALVFLIAVLNASFPDYDFSDIQADEFRHETNVYTTVSS